MKTISNIWYLIQKDFSIELRQRYIIASILLYVVSSVFIISKILQTVSPMLWNAIFWILFIFTGVTAMMKSFSQEISNRSLYYYYLVGPIEVIIAKFLYNAFSLFLMGVLISLSFIVFINNPIDQYGLFYGSIALGALSVGIIFTLVSSIAAKGGNSATLMSVMSIPLVLPTILLNLQITAASMNIIQDTAILSNIGLVLAITAILVGVSLFLFPQIWRT